MSQMEQVRPIRVAVLNDFELIVAGVAHALADFADRVEVVELDVGRPALGDVDVVLYDTFSKPQGALLDVDRVRLGSSARVLVFTWNTSADLVTVSLAQGAAGLVSKASTAAQLVEAIEAVHAGAEVRPVVDGEAVLGRWPGQQEGLSAREAEVLALIAQGLTNQEIGAQAFIAMNTVKTHIRHLYRKIGVETRPQAVIWAFAHGFERDDPHRDRDVEGTTA